MVLPENEIMLNPVRDDEVDIKRTRNEEPQLLNIPLDVLTIIMEFCVGVEYLNFRATCKHCKLAAPMIQWSNEASLTRLQTYSLNSPWLIEFDKHQGIITFTDPMFGDKYFKKTPQKLIGNLRIYCSRYGWLLLFKHNKLGELFFYNPFTNDIRELPNAPYFDSLCFLEPPTSPDCMVVGSCDTYVFIYFVISSSSSSSSWTRVQIELCGTNLCSFRFLTFDGEKFFALNQGALYTFLKDEGTDDVHIDVVAKAPRKRSSQYFLVNCDQHVLLVVISEMGEFVEVLKLNDSKQEWEKIDSLGRHMIYISSTMCLCMEAKTPEMENKIYFLRLHSKSGKIIFYSLETRGYHTFNGRHIEECLEGYIGTRYHAHPLAWIEPSWS